MSGTERTLNKSIAGLLQLLQDIPTPATTNICGFLPSDTQAQMVHDEKDDESTDEDQRVLASEEGRMLSSRERRQLRNKVSARAFRNRRKQYISQLERDLAFKTIESRKLRTDIEALTQKFEECRSLIVALLKHPAFSDYYEWHQ